MAGQHEASMASLPTSPAALSLSRTTLYLIVMLGLLSEESVPEGRIL